MGTTTDPTDPTLGHGSNDEPVPMNEKYLVLSDAERAKGFVRPYRTSYKHAVPNCGGITTMAASIAETYARQPSFYGATYCSTCCKHRPVGTNGEFVWLELTGAPTTDKVGT